MLTNWSKRPGNVNKPKIKKVIAKAWGQTGERECFAVLRMALIGGNNCITSFRYCYYNRFAEKSKAERFNLSALLVRVINLSLNAARTVAAHERFNVFNRNHIEIEFNGVLKAGSRNGVFNGILGGITADKGINKATAEGIAAANAINNVNGVFLGEAVITPTTVLIPFI